MRGSQKSKIFYGYHILGVCFLAMFFLWGMVLNTFPVFFKPITEDMGWGRGQLAGAILMGSIGTMALLPVAGRMLDRLGAKAVMMAGGLFVGVGLLLGSLVTDLWQIYVVFFLVGAGIACGTILPCSYLISNWFVARRGTAMGVAFVGMAAGGMVMAPVANWIIVNYSWRTAFTVAGLEIFLLLLPAIHFIVRSRPSEMNLEPYRNSGSEKETEGELWGPRLTEAFALPVFWQISGIFLIFGIVTGGINYHCVAYLTDIGHLQTKATYAWSIAMGLMVVGQILSGPVADRWGAKNTMVGVCLLFTIAIGALTTGKPYSITVAFAVLYGFAMGGGLVMGPLLTAEHLGLQHFGAIFGILNVVGTIGGGVVGPVAPGVYFDLRNTYLPVFYVFFGLVIVAVALSLLIKPARRFGRIPE